MYDFDLVNSPLQIKTDSLIGSSEEVRLQFFRTANDGSEGEITLYFSSTPGYKIHYCKGKKDFLTTLPTETDKVWTFTLSKLRKAPYERRLVINCNNKEIVNVVLSDTLCTSYSDWWKIWQIDVNKIKFPASLDTASDYYRPGKYF